MRRRERFAINQRFARLEARLDEVAPSTSGPSRAAPLDMFTDDYQRRFLREGNVYRGKVYL